MNQKTLANWLRAVVVLAACAGGLVYGVVIPNIGLRTAERNPEYAYCFWPWLIFLLATAVPCYLVLWQGWKILSAVRRDESFTRENARRLGTVSKLAAFDAAFLFAGSLIFLLLGMSHPGVFLALLLISAFGLIVTVAAALLSHLVYKAALLREDADLTV